MSEALLNAGRQTLMLELQEASRLPERLGDDFVRAANIILHCEGKVVVSGITLNLMLIIWRPVFRKLGAVPLGLIILNMLISRIFRRTTAFGSLDTTR